MITLCTIFQLSNNSGDHEHESEKSDVTDEFSSEDSSTDSSDGEPTENEDDEIGLDDSATASKDKEPIVVNIPIKRMDAKPDQDDGIMGNCFNEVQQNVERKGDQ